MILQSDVPTSQNLGYIDIGINNQGYSEAFFNVNGPLDGYLLAVASGSVGGNLAIGCDTSGKQIQFVAGGFAQSNQIMQISDLAPQVQITGSLYVTNGITGSITTASYVRNIFSKGGTFYDPLGIAGTAAFSQSVVIWRAPYACTVTNVLGQRVTGSGAVINAWRTSGTVSGSIAATNITLNTASLWMSASSLNAASTSFSIGDELDIMLVSSSGYPTQISVQIDLVK